ncbi:mitochondrial distribution and morphology protein 10 [Sistotremastrum niveocremeum HHB9708]|uniref:Mitochondrial distribution and morphology protein 10 n=1 Tax=Sistotremastrum niveocremeum HHB9708 TaxID=1314777 RepID=A0A164ZDW2_9AGAM|nr:mitochondrial distribution and morphology protein 10 [Sistotremastrum niveocremeum HHB9708]
MHPFASYVLRSYYAATGWNEDNLYSNLTRSSTAILDFIVPRGLNFSISKSPNALFKTTYSMTALPSLNGSVGYIFTSCDLNLTGSADVRLKDMIDRFRVYDVPHRPEAQEEIWLAGNRVDRSDYLLYGRLHISNGRLDALYSKRISPTLQTVIAAISDPVSKRSRPSLTGDKGRPDAGGVNNMMVSLQHDVGKWCSEYTWSADDGMLGVRVLHNFGKIGPASELLEDSGDNVRNQKRIDEEEAMEGGLKGRISAGAEFYFSAKEKSAGVSTGIRFTTLPDATPPSNHFQSHTPDADSTLVSGTQPPTTITAIFNPMMGHISTAYAARVSRSLCLASRFDFNVYSYESEWTMGAEWWMRRGSKAVEPSSQHQEEFSEVVPHPDTVQGVFKARVSTNTDISLMWEGRVRSMLVSLGAVSDLTSRSSPIRAIGLELSYFSSE